MWKAVAVQLISAVLFTTLGDSLVSASPSQLSSGKYLCKDGTTIYDYEICDGHIDCSNSEDESNCTRECSSSEYRCPSQDRCILRKWLCDGDQDCNDGSDEKNCAEAGKQSTEIITAIITDTSCNETFCYSSSQCLSWTKLCDGKQDCLFPPDEGELCSRSCSDDKGGCSQICQKTPWGSKCLCQKGFRLLPDNKTCSDTNECLQLGTCSQFCDNTEGSFKCSCAEGYLLDIDRRTCKVDGGPKSIVYLLGDQIKGINIDSHFVRTYLTLNDSKMVGMDYDASENLFYWLDGIDGSIYSYLDTQKQIKIAQFDQFGAKPIWIKYDWIGKNLYFIDSDSNIKICAKDGRYCRTLIHTEHSISSMDISPTTRQIFWSVRRNKNLEHIERAEMDGSRRLMIISNQILDLRVIAVDHVLKLIYWIDSNGLEGADFSGFNRRIISQRSTFYPFGMTVLENFIYISDWGTVSIVRCEKFTGFCSTYQRNVKALVLVAVHNAMQPAGINHCLNNSCPQLCVPTRSTSVCMCGEDFIDRNGLCESKLATTTSTTAAECPKDYCIDGTECVVTGAEYVCMCLTRNSEKSCKKEEKIYYEYMWAALILLAFMPILAVVILKLRKKFRRMEITSIKFQKTKQVEMDDDGSCRNLI